ncbi:hypothetical protein B9Z55_006995 [Caenorhabditis nigoni]|uniref:Uncharacterized protein n=1 Tax=Caenorhabditis nigoni TaxID=1611254 RepID=A0A2G5V7H1_9PELO|nr:hypothetical protein B9Z55_006995 [Caenorhabditis nigoni]
MDIPFEITPKNLVISPNNPLQVQVRNDSIYKEVDVYVTVDSLLFRILNPTGVYKTETQVYSSMKSDETLHFQIGLVDEATLNQPFEDGGQTYCKSIEGDFQIIYGPDLYSYKKENYVYSMSDIFEYYEELKVNPVRRTCPLALEHETEAIKKRKIEHEKYRKKHTKEIEEWNAKQELIRQSLKEEEEQKINREKEIKENVEKMREEKLKIKKKHRKCILM